MDDGAKKHKTENHKSNEKKKVRNEALNMKIWE